MTTSGPERDLGSLMVELTKLIRRRSLTALEPFGLSPAQGRAFRVIAHHDRAEHDDTDELRLSGLAERLRIAPRSTTEVVDRLEELGLVRRSPSPSDRRAISLTLTDKGRQVRKSMDQARVEGTGDLFGALTTAERGTLAHLLTKALDDADDRR
ncbi:MarR family winged helix-turn-helix transcriptional regulator [Luteipulveratus mongoliensis]|uniref:HTH marR-type domain-containing protein n=1 Tax=Luteipulveratus mongoliensis TaxID=571913 RepID=A0A0K1JMM6_9MICO|nr:MarR family transcriptional regulator [Luteipulveratus mongoliensis]AKU17972.1 hypothetical protein VV02_22415 [Luteipulveratus mongoliensis]